MAPAVASEAVALKYHIFNTLAQLTGMFFAPVSCAIKLTLSDLAATPERKGRAEAGEDGEGRPMASAEDGEDGPMPKAENGEDRPIVKAEATKV